MSSSETTSMGANSARLQVSVQCVPYMNVLTKNYMFV